MEATQPLSTPDSSPVYCSAIVFAIFSLLITFLILPPLVWHARNHNVGATVLVSLAIIANFQNFLNAVIWPNDNFDRWFGGHGLCDVEVKLQCALQVACPAALFCILRGLAGAMDAERASWNRTIAQKRRTMAIDLICCVFLPLLQMPFHYIVQPFRYYIFGIAGCTTAVDGTWVYAVLLLLPPLLWIFATVYYAVLILIRVIRYRVAFGSIMANNNTTKSRFFRLYCLCGICIVGLLTVSAVSLHQNRIALLAPYSWSGTHDSMDPPWNSVIYVRSDGNILYDRYIWLIGGFLIFFLFGFGRDALQMYRSALVAVGVDRMFPRLRQGACSSTSGSSSSVGSKARLFFRQVNPMSTSTTGGSTCSSDEGTPKRAAFVDVVVAEGDPVANAPVSRQSRTSLTSVRLTAFSNRRPYPDGKPESLPLKKMTVA